MNPKGKNIFGGDSITYNSHVWLCNCSKCKMSFYSKKTRLICESCETIDKRDEKINTLLNNDGES